MDDKEHDGERQIPLCKLNIENITYEPIIETARNVNTKSKHHLLPSVKRKRILNNISPPPIEPFKLQAWMGPSGSGKTTLLSIASGVIEYNPDTFNENSRITLNDDPINFLGGGSTFPKGLTGVVWQDDLLLSNLTVRETIEFSAKLKSSPSSNDHKVNEMVDQVLSDLSLTSVQHSKIGGGISGGERKRVSVAQELVARPSLLFLDEPTSGLDSTSALELMLTLKNLAQKGGHSIVTIVHQPRTKIFDLMDGLLLLSRGEEVYSGPAEGVRKVLESCPIVGYDLPPMTNVADWIIDVVKKDEAREQQQQRQQQLSQNHNDSSNNQGEIAINSSSTYSDRCLPRHWLNIKSQQQLEEGQNTYVNEQLYRLSTLAEIQSTVPKYMTSFMTQLRLLTGRAVKQMRGERISTATILSQVAYLLFESILWFRLSDDTDRIYERNSLLFFFIIGQSNGLVTSSVPIFRRDQALVSRERSKKLYQVLPYYLARTAAELTTSIVVPMVHVMIAYWTTNLRMEVGPFFMFMLLFYLTLTSAQSIGFLLSASLPSLQVALVLAPTISIFFLIMGGFYVPFANIPLFIRWSIYLSFASYGYSGLLINEYRGRDIPCGADVSISIGGGECPVKGEDVLEALGITGLFSKMWFNILMMIILQAACRVGAYIFLRRTS